MALTLDILGTSWPVYGPAGGTDLPGVVILHGGEGPMAGWSHRFAAVLAAHGLLALPWSYGEGDFFGVTGIAGVDVTGALAALDALSRDPRCRGAGLFGWSMGAELALLLAAHADPAPAFVAAHAGADRVGGAFDPALFRSGEGETRDAGRRAWIWPGRDGPDLAPGAEIPIERYPGPVFLSVGLADEIRDPANTRRLAARLEAAGRPADLFEVDGQGHAYDFQTEPLLWERLLSFIGGAV